MATAVNEYDLPKTKARAIELGLSRYFNGKPCPKGHVAPRAVSNCGCIQCRSERGKKWREENPEKMKEARASWSANNKEVEREMKLDCARRKYAEDPLTQNKRSAEWREKNRDAHNQKRREKRASNLEVAREMDRIWREKNPDKTRATLRKSYEKRRAIASVRINDSMSAGIKHSLKNKSKNGARWESLVGYTVKDLMARLEPLFAEGMSWENYGEWHIDHIVPLAVHNFETPTDIDFKKAWALSNLQPLWGRENQSKGAKITKSFQPSLAF